MIQSINIVHKNLLSNQSQPLNVPNAITPNGDGKNDYFVIKNLPADARVLIYNRWGNKVFEGSNYDNIWEWADLPDGTYFYLLYLKEGDGKIGFIDVRRLF